jgi:nicotinate-nucleotide adenylyltransferase
MDIALYFGSFNPVHNGHLIIANHIRQNTSVDQVWFVVSPQNPQKKNLSLLNEFHRLYLVQISIEDESGLKASDVEFRLPKPSYTVDTLTYLHEKYPDHRFSVVMGSDSFTNIESWKNFEHLLKNYSVIVYVRPGFEKIKQYEGANVTVLEAPLLQISATHIREMIKMGQSIRYLVPDKVKEEIERNGYYRQ